MPNVTAAPARREKTFRHEYGFVTVDDEGNEVELEGAALRAKEGSAAAAKSARKPAAKVKGRAGHRANPDPHLLAAVAPEGGALESGDGGALDQSSSTRPRWPLGIGSVSLRRDVHPMTYWMDGVVYQAATSVASWLPSRARAECASRTPTSAAREGTSRAGTRLSAAVSIIVKRVLSGPPYQSNCYLVRAGERSEQAVAIDPGGDSADVLAELGEATSLAGILVTHGDVDHIAGVAELARSTRAAVWIPAGEAGALRTGTTRGGFGSLPTCRARAPRRRVRCRSGGMSFDVLSVPGHFLPPSRLPRRGKHLSGDLIFTGSIGRQTSPVVTSRRFSPRWWVCSSVPGPQAVVYPGHGDPTTLRARARDQSLPRSAAEG